MSNQNPTLDQFPHDNRICQIIKWLTDQNTKEDYFDFLLVELSEDSNVYSFCRLLAVLEAKKSISLQGIDHDNNR